MHRIQIRKKVRDFYICWHITPTRQLHFKAYRLLSVTDKKKFNITPKDFALSPDVNCDLMLRQDVMGQHEHYNMANLGRSKLADTT